MEEARDVSLMIDGNEHELRRERSEKRGRDVCVMGKEVVRHYRWGCVEGDASHGSGGTTDV